MYGHGWKKSTDCLSEDIGIRTIKYTAEKDFTSTANLFI